MGAGQELPSPAGKIISAKEDTYIDNVNVSSQLQFYTVSEHTSSLHLVISSSGNISASGVITAQNLKMPGFNDVSASLAAALAGGDNLGNHTAEQDLNLARQIACVLSMKHLGIHKVKVAKRINRDRTSMNHYMRNHRHLHRQGLVPLHHISHLLV